MSLLSIVLQAAADLTPLAKMGAGLLEMKTEALSLEDIFIKAIKVLNPSPMESL